MGRLRVLSGAEICGILAEHGFVEVAGGEAIIIMQRRREHDTISVPVPARKEVRLGTLQSIIRQSRLERAVFEDN